MLNSRSNLLTASATSFYWVKVCPTFSKFILPKTYLPTSGALMSTRTVNLPYVQSNVVVKLGSFACTMKGTNSLLLCKDWSVLKTFSRPHSSKEWLLRQKTDPYVERAKINSYRCRSAFKLLQIDDRFSILKPGQCVIDVGAAPGSWSQVAATRINSNSANCELPKGLLIGIDLQQMYPIEGVTLLGNSDFTCPKTWEKTKQILNGRPLDVVLSDMAPNATGVKHLDHDLIIKLAYSVIKFAVLNSSVGAACLIKILEGNQNSEIEKTLSKFYSNVKFVKPEASRSDSAEKYLLARRFKGLK